MIISFSVSLSSHWLDPSTGFTSTALPHAVDPTYNIVALQFDFDWDPGVVFTSFASCKVLGLTSDIFVPQSSL